ncbi:hypothetical protein AB4Y38_39275 [Paraburkholderia sp. EG285A]|uniref:hypothetical protein n=1 Tax=Paraburkholderia sp. EG285A TaxID=3237009 RepID=UPI0034D1A455
MDELKPDFAALVAWARRYPQGAAAVFLFAAGVVALSCGVASLAGALFGAGAALLGAWVTQWNTQRSSAAEKSGREANARRYMTPELRRVVERVLHIHNRAIVNYSAHALQMQAPNDKKDDFVPIRPVLYPSAPQFHDLPGEDALALIELYDSLNEIDRLVHEWYDRDDPGPRENFYNVVLEAADKSLGRAHLCIERFDLDSAYPPKNPMIGTLLERVVKAIGETPKVRESVIRKREALSESAHRQ